MYIFMSVNMYATRRCTHGVPTVYPYPQYPWLTQPEGRWVRVLTGTGTGQPGITRGLPVLIPTTGPPLLQEFENMLLMTVDELKASKRIISTPLALEEMLNSAEEQEIGDSPYQFEGGDA